MTIDPIGQLGLFLAAFLCGAFLGLLSELGRILRILLGAHTAPPTMRRLYERPLPLLGRAVGWRTHAAHRLWRTAVFLLGDFFFPLVAALAFLWVTFRFQGGVFRPMALCLLLGGFALWRVAVSRHTAGLFALLAFVLALLWLYIRVALVLPLRLLWWLFHRLLVAPLALLLHRLCYFFDCRRSARLCRAQLLAAQRGFH